MTESALDILLESAPMRVVLYDKDFKIIKVSKHILVKTGFDEDYFRSLSIYDIIHEKDAETLKVKLQEFKNSNNETISVDNRVISSSRKYLMVRSSIKKVSIGSGCYLSIGTYIGDLRAEILKSKIEIEKYKRLEKIAKIGLWEIDLKTNTTFWSEETYRIHKISTSERAEAKNSMSMYHEQDKAKIIELYTQCVESGKPYDTQLRMIDREGNLVWIATRGQVAYDSAGNAIKTYGTFQDITEQKLNELDKVKAQNLAGLYQEIIDDFAIVVKTDAQGKITYVNDKFCEISKYRRDELLGQDHRILNSGTHPSLFFKNMWETITAGKFWRAEVCNKAKDGSFYWVDTFISPLFNENRFIDGYMAIRIDITDKKKMEKNIEEERDKATISSKMATVGEMSAGIAHEINNPLAVISGTVDILNLKIQKEKYDQIPKQVKTIKKAIERISKIIKGLKRVSYRSHHAELEKVSMREIMDDTLDFSREMLKSKGIDLFVEDLPECLIECRSVEISQVILNLINNARDAISDLEDKWIKIQTFQMGNQLRVNVIDSGNGIPLDIQDKIMESFFTTKELGKGTGLGLSLSKRIVEEHNGQLFIDNENENTCFSLILPIIVE
jgi:PAS domain S-box-containing protein